MSNTALLARKRGAKVTPKQKKILLRFMADQPFIFLHKVTSEFTIEHHRAFWRNMTAVLNILGPPRKTVESWKKAWKDIKLRYRKLGIDLREVLGTLKTELVVNTRALLEKAEQLNSKCQSKTDEELLREAILDEIDPDNVIPDMNVSRTEDGKTISLNDICNVKLEMDETLLDPSENEDSHGESIDILKNEKSDEKDEDLCEVAYEEISESDLEELNDQHVSTSIESSLKRKSDSVSISNGLIIKDESESDSEILKSINPLKKLKPNSESSSSKSPSISSSNVKPKSESNSLLNSLLVELRQHNRIQSEKLALKKKHFEEEKRLLEETLSVRKDIAKAHLLLAKTVKTFVDNISFNT